MLIPNTIFGIIIFGLYVIPLSQSVCQEKWIIRTEDGLLHSVRFKSQSTFNQYETLNWKWHGKNGVWSSRIWQHLIDNGRTTGGFRYSQFKYPALVTYIRWEENSTHLSWVSEGNITNEKDWEISLCWGSKLSFSPSSDGSWILEKDGIEMEGNTSRHINIEKDQQYYREKNYIKNRFKREKIIPNMAVMLEKAIPSNNGTFRSWMESTLTLVFGEANGKNIMNTGILTSLFEWLSGFVCIYITILCIGENNQTDVTVEVFNITNLS